MPNLRPMRTLADLERHLVARAATVKKVRHLLLTDDARAKKCLLQFIKRRWVSRQEILRTTNIHHGARLTEVTEMLIAEGVIEKRTGHPFRRRERGGQFGTYYRRTGGRARCVT